MNDFYSNDDEFLKARDAAARYLSYRARSRKEVWKKLAESGFDDDTAEAVIAEMERLGYIDDVKFCEMFVHEKTSLNGFGSLRIARDLRAKGVDPEIIEKCVADYINEAGLDETEPAYAILSAKYRRGGVPKFEDRQSLLKFKRKCVDFLLMRGFPRCAAEEAFKRLVEE